MIDKWEERQQAGEPVPQFGIDTTPESAASVWEALLVTLEPVVYSADIDAYPSPEWEQFRAFSPEVAEAYNLLLEVAEKQKAPKRDWKMAIHLNVHDPTQRHVLRVFGSETIHVDLYDDSERVVGGMHDEGTSCWAALLDSERDLLLRSLAERGISDSAVTPLPKRRRWFGLRHN